MREYVAQKRTTRHCSERCTKAGYKMRKRMEADNMFQDQETIKRMLFKIHITLERVESVLDAIPKQYVANEKEILSAKEFCQIVNISRKTFDRLMNREEIVVSKVGSRLFVNRNEINKIKSI